MTINSHERDISHYTHTQTFHKQACTLTKRATGATEMIYHCILEGSLSVSEVAKDWRPYHRNCSCALHKQKEVSSILCFQHKRISFKKRLSITGFSSNAQFKSEWSFIRWKENITCFSRETLGTEKYVCCCPPLDVHSCKFHVLFSAIYNNSILMYIDLW